MKIDISNYNGSDTNAMELGLGMCNLSNFEAEKKENGGAISVTFANSSYLTFIIGKVIADNCQAQNGGFISIQDLNAGPNSFGIIESAISNTTALGNGGAILAEISHLYINGLTFDNNTAQIGSSFYGQTNNTLIANTTFALQSSNAKNGGPTYGLMGYLTANTFNYSETNVPSLGGQRNFFYQNLQGFSILQYRFKYQESMIDREFLKSLYYKCHSHSSQPQLESNDDLQLSTTANPHCQELEKYFEIVNETYVKLSSESTDITDFPEKLQQVVVGQGLNTFIVVAALDKNGYLIETFDESYLHLQVLPIQNSNTVVRISGDNLVEFVNGYLVLYDQLQFIATPANQNSSKLNFTTKIDLQQTSSSLNLFGPIKFHISFNSTMSFSCLNGQYFDVDSSQCVSCPSGSYSFSNNQACDSCKEDEIYCYGGNTTSVLAGYYRYDANSMKVSRCTYEKLCLGSINSTFDYNPNGFCKHPAKGNMCQSCDQGFAIDKTAGNCVECEATFWLVFKMIIFGLVKILFVLYSLSAKVDKTEFQNAISKDESSHESIHEKIIGNSIVKIVTSMMQLIDIIRQYRFQWPDLTKVFFGISSYTSTTIASTYSIACMLRNFADLTEFELFYINYFGALLKPIFLWVLVIIFRAIFHKIQAAILRRQSSRNSKKSLSWAQLFIIVAFIEQPSVVLGSIDYMYCNNLGTEDSPQYFLASYPDVRCDGQFYLTIKWALNFPWLLLWGFIFPYLLFLSVKKKKEKYDKHRKESQIEDMLIFSKYSFVVSGFKDKYYYWEFLLIARKITIIMIFVFLGQIGPQGQLFATFTILSLFGIFNISKDPFIKKELNYLENMTVLVMISLCVVGIYFIGSQHSIYQWAIGFKDVIAAIGLALFGLFLFYAFLVYRRYKKLHWSTLRDRVGSIVRSKRQSVVLSELKAGSKDSKLEIDFGLHEGEVQL